MLEITDARSNPSILEQTRTTLGAWDPALHVEDPQLWFLAEWQRCIAES